MRLARLSVLLCVFLLGVQVRGQQATNPQLNTAPQTVRDPQAVSVLNQALGVAGGVTALSAIQDYTASGDVVYSSEQDGKGTVTVKGLGATEFRMDANLPAGVRTLAVSNGAIVTKDEKGTISSNIPNATAPSSDAFPYQTPLFPSSTAFPYRQLSAVVNNPRYSLIYKGIVETDGHSAHEIELQRIFPEASSTGGFAIPPRTRDIFIDTTTFQVVKVSETLPKNTPHELHYSDYRPVSGVLMPFSIAEEIANQQTWTIQLNQINFNAGLQASSFAIQ